MAETIINTPTPLISLKEVNIFQGENLILSDVNLNVRKGEFVYLIGKTGSGKSSLLKTFYGDLPLNNGEGQVVGFDLRKMNWKKVPDLRRRLGIVFQDFQLLTDRSVFDNLSFVLKATGWKEPKKIEERVHDVLKLVGIETKSFKFPHELSGGEQQRIVIARALLNEPELILADEPTGNLDPETSDDIINLLRTINRETHTAIVMATHDYYILEKFPSRIIQCQAGQVIDSESIEVGR